MTDNGGRLTFAKLEPLARARAARLLALDDPRIARQQSLLPQLLAMPLVRQAQRPRDRESHRPRLPRHPTAPAQRPHVEGAERVGRRERLLNVRHERRPGKIVAQRPPVDVPFSGAGREIHARHADLAAPDRVPAQLRRDGRAHRASARLSGSGCCAACGCSGPAYTFSICFTFWRESVVFGSMPHTAFSITRSGRFSRTFLTGANRSWPM